MRIQFGAKTLSVMFAALVALLPITGCNSEEPAPAPAPAPVAKPAEKPADKPAAPAVTPAPAAPKDAPAKPKM